MAVRPTFGINTALNYAKGVFLTREPVRDIRVYYCVNSTPPALEAHWNGDKYRVLQNGETFVFVGETPLPLPGCLFPRELATLQMFISFRRAMRFLPLIVLSVLAWVVGQWFLWSIPDSPAEEMRYSLIAVFSWWINAALIALFAIVVVAVPIPALVVSLYNFYVRTIPDTDNGLLSAGQPDISPDIFVLSVRDESGQDFMDRLDNVRRGQKPGQYVVVLSFRNPMGVVLTGTGTDYHFNRDCPPFDERGVTHIVPPGFRFTEETWREYETYCFAFADQFREWAARNRHAIVTSPIKTYSLEIS